MTEPKKPIFACNCIFNAETKTDRLYDIIMRTLTDQLEWNKALTAYSSWEAYESAEYIHNPGEIYWTTLENGSIFSFPRYPFGMSWDEGMLYRILALAIEKVGYCKKNRDEFPGEKT